MSNVIEKNTFCRICEPMCGLKVQVEDGRVTKVRGAKDHIQSKGHLCAKAQAAAEMTYDPDRVLSPLKRNSENGEFEKISWSQAYSEIAAKLTTIRNDHGAESIALCNGNPASFYASLIMWLGAFKNVMGIKWAYAPGAEDTAAPMVAAHLLYGSLGAMLKPDLWRTDFVLIIGANPYVAHSSLFTEPLLREACSEVKERGGRVVVVDPRHTETARRSEHVAINAGTDAWLLSAMLQTIIAEDLVDYDCMQGKVEGFDVLASELAQITPELAAGHTGIAADDIRQLARDFANADSACVIGRTGTCTQQFGTLCNILQGVLCIVTGNVDSEGGMLFGEGLFDFSQILESVGANTFGTRPSRTTGQPDVALVLPITSLATDILEPGDGQIRALLTVGTNPMLCAPGGGKKLKQALEALDLHVSLDFYVNETNRFADYILPATTMYEREDIPLFNMSGMLRPAMWATEAVAEPQGEVKPEWQIFNDLCKAMGFGGCYDSKLFRLLARFGYEIKPEFFFDMIIRTSAWGDRFGLRRTGISFKKLVRQHANGYNLMPYMPTGEFDKKVRTANRRVNLGRSEIIEEMQRLRNFHDKYQDFPYRLIGQREMLSQNSWLHNVETTMKKGRGQAAKVHTEDAIRHQLVDGDTARIESPWGEIEVKVKLTDDMKPGNIALPHGWGHNGGWQRANQGGGVNSNVLTSDRAEDHEWLSATSLLNGVPIRLSASAST